MKQRREHRTMERVRTYILCLTDISDKIIGINSVWSFIAYRFVYLAILLHVSDGDHWQACLILQSLCLNTCFFVGRNQITKDIWSPFCSCNILSR